VLEVDLGSATTECRAAGISPSGKLLALYRVSRGLVYSHADAMHDDTNVVEAGWRREKSGERTLRRLGWDHQIDRNDARMRAATDRMLAVIRRAAGAKAQRAVG
jgi:hypothetical protein